MCKRWCCTSTERLGARRKQNANDVEGWRMLGWSYFHAGRFARGAQRHDAGNGR